MPAVITSRDLAEELLHTDHGRAIERFLRRPDDGRGPFTGYRFGNAWRLTPEQADRVRERFS